MLVVGCIHGDECAGMAVVRELRRRGVSVGRHLWLLPNLNPDGLVGGHRQNGRGVDLNRNFPSQWRPNGARWDNISNRTAPSSKTVLASDLASGLWVLRLR